MRILFAVVMLLGLGALPGARAEFLGYTEPVRAAKPAFAEAGILAVIHVSEGERVEEGQVLAELDNRILVHDRVVAEQQLQLQAQRHDQMLALRERGNISAEEYERARADWEIARERVRRIQTQIETRTLRAPFAGVVVRVFREISESIPAQSAEVLSLVKLDQLDVVLNLPPEKVAGLEPGQEMPVLLERKHAHSATLVHISPIIDAASRTVRVRLRIDNPDGALKAGMISILE